MENVYRSCMVVICPCMRICTDSGLGARSKEAWVVWVGINLLVHDKHGLGN
jgi:hypothetical protein